MLPTWESTLETRCKFAQAERGTSGSKAGMRTGGCLHQQGAGGAAGKEKRLAKGEKRGNYLVLSKPWSPASPWAASSSSQKLLQGGRSPTL